MKKVIILLDAGHGGIVDGVYQTSGKRSPVWSDGTQLFEGEFNRAIVRGIHHQLVTNGIDARILVPEQDDISLSERVKRANDIYRSNPDAICYFISVHSNAGGGSGFEIYTYHGQSKSDELADCIAQAFKDEFPDEPLRIDQSDGDLDKEANFYVLRKTAMPAVLTENFFMDNEEECKEILMTVEGRSKIVAFHVNGIMKMIAPLSCPCCGRSYGDS
ncbi:N-acetylmuramoyl-L-alanine amidase [Photobacterium damselae]|uniref:N-acetylmuramoyl-L-alanine amidase n=1 Tax=Photobacterium damselae TaxID=38293 RepID=UPI0040681E44